MATTKSKGCLPITKGRGYGNKAEEKAREEET